MEIVRELPTFVVAVLLLAAVPGAIVLARQDYSGPSPVVGF